MAKYPVQKDLDATTVDIVNAIRNAGTLSYQERVPEATQENIKEWADSVLTYVPTANEFLSNLVNLVIKQVLISKSYKNPLRMLKKGELDYGETIEEIFVNIAKANEYDPEAAETDVEKRVIPDVKAAFHKVDLKNFYKATVQQADLRHATASWDALRTLINGIIESLYSGSELDEFLCMKQQLAYAITEDRCEMVKIPEVSGANAKEIAAVIKEWSNKLTFMSSNYNFAGVATHTPKADQVILMSTKLDALVDVEVLASAFNLPYVDFLNQRILVDDFGTDEDGNPLDVECMIIDREFFQVYDNLNQMAERFNEQGLYWNYFYHIWRIFGVSPFANAVAFSSNTGVTSVTVDPAETSVAPGETEGFTAEVVVTGYAPKEVIWTISGQTSDDTVISEDGKLTLGSDETDGGTITVTATSVFDSTKSGTAEVTVDA